MSDTEAAKIAASLTDAQRRRMRLEIIVLRSRHDTRVALNLERMGLVKRGPRINQFSFTPKGLAVRAYLTGASNNA